MPKLKRGHYVLATRWEDGNPRDPFAVCFFVDIFKGKYVVEWESKDTGKHGFCARRVQKISQEEGDYIVSIIPEITDRDGPSLWSVLRQFRKQKKTKSNAMISHEEIAKRIAETAHDLALRYIDKEHSWEYIVALRRAANRIQDIYGPRRVSEEEIAKMAPPPPAELVGALQDVIHKEIGVRRVVGQHWIKCSERMPEENDQVLLLLLGGTIVFGDRTGKSKFYVSPCGICDSSNRAWLNLHQVTHWMPLPEPPE